VKREGRDYLPAFAYWWLVPSGEALTMSNINPAPAPPLRFVLHVLIYSVWILIIVGGLSLFLIRSLVPVLGGVGAAVVGGVVLAGIVALYVRAHRRLRTRERIIVARPVAEVFHQLATEFFTTRAQSIARHTPPGTAFTVEQTSAGPFGVGTTGHEVVELNGQRSEWFYHVTVYDPPRTFARTATSPQAPMQLHSRYDLTPVPGGTQLTMTSDFAPRGLWRLFTPFYARYYSGYIRGGAGRLKELLEA
jgi:hypothetical protein